MSSGAVYRPQGRLRRLSNDGSQLIQLPARTREEKVAQQVAFWTLFVAGMLVSAGTAGAVIGWVTLFAPDNNYAQRFGKLVQEDASIQMAIDGERTSREASDIHVQAIQDALNSDIAREIANRTSQDMQLMSLLAAEVASREAFQALLRQLLGDEITYRLGNDTIIGNQLTDLETRLATLNAYDIYALQQFMIKMGNLTNIADTLATEIATREASDAVLSAQDAAQVNSIASLGPAIAAERATRIAFDDYVSSLLDPLVNGGLFSINGMPGVQNNFNINAGPGCAFVVGSGGGNVITLSNNAIISLAGMTADPATNNIGLVGDGNVVVTPNPGGNSINIALAVAAIPGNVATYSGSVTSLFGFADNRWQFDFFPAYGSGPSSFISNYNTYNGRGWEIPTVSGVGDGIWVVQIKFTATWTLSQTPYTAPLTVGTCVGTYAFCANNPHVNEPAKTYRYADINSRAGPVLALWGIQTQDIVIEYTIVVDGRGVPAGTGVYPVWRSENILAGGQVSTLNVVAINVLYYVSRIF